MNKKQFLELLIKSFGLIPEDVRTYRTLGSEEFESKIGWKGEGLDKNGDTFISFAEPDGFNMAVYEILRQTSGMEPEYVHE